MISILNSLQRSGMIKLQFLNITNQRSGEVSISPQTPEESEWLIGRGNDCYLVLDDPKVSRKHARIKLIDGAFYFSDIGSRWGSVINGKELAYNQFQMVQEGDTIILGDTAIYIKETFQLATTPEGQSTTERTPQPSEYWSDGDIVTRCFRIVQETPDSKTFWLTGNPPTLFYYLPGQFVSLELEIDGKTVLRPYSISSSPSRPYALGITVKRVPSPPSNPEAPPGLVSNWLNSHLKEGDTLKIVRGAMGNFTCLPDLPPKMLFIGAGSGITPLMSMCRWFYDTASEADITLINSVRTPADIIFKAELEQMAAQMSTFKLAITVTRSHPGLPWSGLTGRINKEMLSLLVPDLHERYIYCCGPDDFMQTTQQYLQELGFPMSQYKQESFGGRKKPKQPELSPQSVISETQTLEHELEEVAASRAASISPASSSNGTSSINRSSSNRTAAPPQTAAPSSNQIQFVNSKQTAELDPDSSILETAEQLGINIPFACRQGACGACKVRVEGDVEYEGVASALSEDDKKKGYVLACIAHATGATTVEA